MFQTIHFTLAEKHNVTIASYWQISDKSNEFRMIFQLEILFFLFNCYRKVKEIKFKSNQ